MCKKANNGQKRPAEPSCPRSQIYETHCHGRLTRALFTKIGVDCPILTVFEAENFAPKHLKISEFLNVLYKIMFQPVLQISLEFKSWLILSTSTEAGQQIQWKSRLWNKPSQKKKKKKPHVTVSVVSKRFVRSWRVVEYSSSLFQRTGKLHVTLMI